MRFRHLAGITAGVALLACTADAATDAQGNEVLTFDEIATKHVDNRAKREEMFKQFDVNKDGVLTADEVGGKGNLSKVDSNGDGSATKGEFMFEVAKEKKKRIDRADKNDDGQIDQGEASTAIEKWKEKRKNKD